MDLIKLWIALLLILFIGFSIWDSLRKRKYWREHPKEYKRYLEERREAKRRTEEERREIERRKKIAYEEEIARQKAKRDFNEEEKWKDPICSHPFRRSGLADAF